MEFHRFGDETDPSALFVLGWGNRTHHAPVRWLIDRIVEDGWHVHTATLPVHVTDVQREWVRPVERYAERLDAPPVLAHSAGGLTVAHTDIDAHSRTYLSPWWGDPPAREGPLVDLLRQIPGDVKFLPSGLDDPDILGVHATDQQLSDGPDRVSPAFLRATHRAHRTLPEIDDEAVVFCSLSDRVVSTRAIGDRLPTERIRLYDGGHELFTSRSRDVHLDTILAAMERGPEAL